MPSPSERAAELAELAMSWMTRGAGTTGQQLVDAIVALGRPELPRIDECLRSWSIAPITGWRTLDSRRIAEAVTTWSVAAVAASHPKGHVREAAVRVLGATRDARALPFVLLRLNDWVAEVRAAARAALASYLAPEFAPALIALLPAIEGLRAKSRAEHEPVVRWVLTLLAGPELLDARLAGCRVDDLEVRRTCLRFSLERAPADARQLLELAIADREPGIRSWAVRSATVELPAAWARALTERGLCDRSAHVRRVALTVVAGWMSPAELLPITERALLDEAAATRWPARRIRTRLGSFDFAAFYREALARAECRKRTRAALLGLGESGVVADVALVRPHLASDAVSVRRVAMTALGALEDGDIVDPFFEALSDPQRGVSREARHALEHRLAHVRTDRVLAVVSSRVAPLHTRANALALGRRLSKWDALLVAVAATLHDDSHTMVVIAAKAVMVWLANYNRSFVAPTADQLTAIESRLDHARLDAPLQAQLRQLLQQARRTWALQ